MGERRMRWLTEKLGASPAGGSPWSLGWRVALFIGFVVAATTSIRIRAGPNTPELPSVLLWQLAVDTVGSYCPIGEVLRRES